MSQWQNAVQNIRGEFVIVVEGKKETEERNETPREQVLQLMEEGTEKKEAIKQVAQRMGVPKNEIYMEVTDL